MSADSMKNFQPLYLTSLQSGELRQRVQKAYARLDACDLCPWECRANRSAGKMGLCRIAIRARVASYGPHLGEEKPLSGWNGSGTIFFSRCNLRCQYCQNHEISQTDAGDEIEPEALAEIMLVLQNAGCHNINLVTPSHVVPQILAAVLLAAQAGLRLPLVYNTGGYDAMAALELLDGVVDIYMPDMKYASAQIARSYSKARDYPRHNQAAVLEMHRQVGDLQVGVDGLAQRGLIIRHLVLPNNLAGSSQVLGFIAEHISLNTYLNLMDQYRPMHNARNFPKLKRAMRPQEYQEVLAEAQMLGLHRLAD
jgi:putative pyruvate formate lyase activating enzyme